MNKTLKRYVAIILSFSILIAAAYGQELSEKRDLSIFRLNYFGAPPAPVPDTVQIKAQIGKASVDIRVQGSGNADTDAIFRQTIGGIDAKIREVFTGLGRFNVFSFPQRLSEDNLDVFLQTIREYREAQVEIPEAVRLGQEAFTEQDLNRLVNSFIVVIPTVTYYQLTPDEDGNWDAEIETSFSIVNVENYQTIAEFTIQSSGFDDDAQRAMRSAVEGIPSQLSFEIRSVEEFKIQTAVLERNGSRLILAFGQDLGIQVGDEYEVTRLTEVSGFAVPRRIALLRIREVNRQFSIAQIIYETERANVGDQVKEVPRFGIDFTPYVAALFSPGSTTLESFSIGVKSAPNRGVYAFRPMFGIEFLISSSSTSGPDIGLPVSFDFGAEYNLFLGRLRLIPQAYAGLIGQIPADETEDFSLRAFKASAALGVSYILPGGDDNFELYLSGGYEFQFGFNAFSSVNGVLVSAGVKIR